MQIGPLAALNGVRIRSWFGDPRGLLTSGRLRRTSPHRGHGDTGNQLSADASIAGAADLDLGLSLWNSFIGPCVFFFPLHGMMNVHMELLPEIREDPERTVADLPQESRD